MARAPAVMVALASAVAPSRPYELTSSHWTDFASWKDFHAQPGYAFKWYEKKDFRGEIRWQYKGCPLSDGGWTIGLRINGYPAASFKGFPWGSKEQDALLEQLGGGDLALFKCQMNSKHDVSIEKYMNRSKGMTAKVTMILEDLITQHDKNLDMELTKDELVEAFEKDGNDPETAVWLKDQIMNKWDKDEDGKISLAELREMAEQKAKIEANKIAIGILKRILATFDTDGDLSLTELEVFCAFEREADSEETAKILADMFMGVWDANGDGKLSFDEIKAKAIELGSEEFENSDTITA